MGKSKRKTPIIGFAGCRAGSMKWYRRIENKRERAFIRDMLRTNQEEKLVNYKQFYNEWASPRDGKQWLDPYCLACSSRPVLFGLFKLECECEETKKLYDKLMRK